MNDSSFFLVQITPRELPIITTWDEPITVTVTTDLILKHIQEALAEYHDIQCKCEVKVMEINENAANKLEKSVV